MSLECSDIFLKDFFLYNIYKIYGYQNKYISVFICYLKAFPDCLGSNIWKSTGKFNFEYCVVSMSIQYFRVYLYRIYIFSRSSNLNYIIYIYRYTLYICATWSFGIECKQFYLCTFCISISISSLQCTYIEKT